MEVTQVGKLTEKAEGMGVSVQEMVIETVKRRKSVNGASKELGVSPNTIHYHLRQAGVKLTVKQIVKLEKVS